VIHTETLLSIFHPENLVNLMKTQWSFMLMNLDEIYQKVPLKTDPIIDDTTLRDGIQMPGLAASPKEAAEIAKLLSESGVERIELFHYQNSDKKAVKLISEDGS